MRPRAIGGIIPRMATPRPDRVTALLAAIGALAAVLVLLRVSQWGPEAGPDATLYVSAARSLLAGEGFTGYRGTPYGDAARSSRSRWPSPGCPASIPSTRRAGSTPPRSA